VQQPNAGLVDKIYAVCYHVMVNKDYQN